MLKTQIGIVSLFCCCATLLNTAQSYRSNYYNIRTPLPTPYPQNRQNWERSDNVQTEQIGRYRYNEESNSQASQIQGGTTDWSPTQTTLNSKELNGMIKEIFQIGPERNPMDRDQNIRGQPYPQTGPYQHSETFHQSFQGQNYQPSINQPNSRGYDDGLIFKVQRNPEGKLNVVFNDTVISQPRPHDGPGIGNRGAQNPIGLPYPTPQPSRDIIFPGDEQVVPQHQRMRPRCLQPGKLFCTEVENYPKDIIESVLHVESVKYEQLFGDDVVPELSPSPNITQRIDAPGEESLCMSEPNLIYPQAGLTRDNNWSFIVNQPNYTQGVRIEECKNPEKPCAMTESFPNTYTTECRQKYIFRQLVSLNPDGKVITDLFPLPSCCTCILKTMNRFKRGVS